jgi:hypothetical protein
MLPLAPEQLFLASVIIAFASAVQASIGFGLALIAAPMLLLIDPGLVPGPSLTFALLLSVLVAHRERHAIDMSGMVWALMGRFLGTLPAVVALQSLSPRDFELCFSLLVLLAVLLSILHPKIRPTRAWKITAGAMSGFMGTISAIGGPPMALLYQNSPAPELRATLSGFFIVGCLISLGVLSLSGLFGERELMLSLTLAPAVVFGFWLSRFTLDRVSGAATRPLVLLLSAASAAGLLLRLL